MSQHLTAQGPWGLELRQGSARPGCHACPNLPCSPGPHPAEPESPVGSPGRRHPAHHPWATPPDRRQHQCLCGQPILSYVSISLLPSLAAVSWGHSLWASVTPFVQHRGWTQGSPRSHESPREMVTVTTPGELCPRGRQSGALVGGQAEARAQDVRPLPPAARSQCVLRPLCATPCPRPAQEKLWFEWSLAMLSAHCWPALSATLSTPSSWQQSPASASEGEELVPWGNTCVLPGRPRGGEVRLSWTACCPHSC